MQIDLVRILGGGAAAASLAASEAFAAPAGGVPPQGLVGQIQMMSGPELPISYWIPVFLILFGALIVWVQYRYLSATKANPEISLPSFSIILIITGTLVLVSTGMNEKILGTAVGLFGTIAGYLLGRAMNPDQKAERRRSSDPVMPKVEEEPSATPLDARMEFAPDGRSRRPK